MTDELLNELRMRFPARSPTHCTICGAIPAFESRNGSLGWCEACVSTAIRLSQLASPGARLDQRRLT